MLLAMVLCTASLAACSSDETQGSKYPAPTVTDFSPKTGLPTSIVTIKGSNFGSERSERIGRVYFGGVEAKEYVSYSDTEIQVRVPDGAVSGPLDVWVYKNHVTTTDEFTYIPGAEIKSINPSVAYLGSEITLVGVNFDTFLSMPLSDILVEFQTEDGATKVAANSLTETELKVTVPTNAKSGAMTVYFGDRQTVTTPELTLVGDYTFNLGEYKEASGSIKLAEGCVDNTKDGAWAIYEFQAPATGIFNVTTLAATTKNGSHINIDISDNFSALKTQSTDPQLTRDMVNTGSWNKDEAYTYGPFYLKEGQTYYLRVLFLQDGSSWVGNLHEVKLSLCADQSATPVHGGSTDSRNYVIYENNFNTGTSYYPFTAAWAWEPNYIRVENKYLEFYYNYEALVKDNRRMRRGAEVTCNFATNSEGWYGFKIYLPEGKFPMDEGGIIIAQIFGQGCNNSWAGHLSIDKGTLKLSHRHALIDPVVGTVGQLETNKWYSVVVYFKVGLNNKGRLKAWLGDDMKESAPAYDSGACRFGFGHWLDDEHLDNTGNNAECKAKNPDYGGKDQIGCKFGLYVSNKTDITIRFDDIKALEGNPAGAFNIVKP